jgi:hypothetical protein
MAKNKEETVLIAARIPKSLDDDVAKLIDKQAPAIKDRTHAIIIALTKLVKGK